MPGSTGSDLEKVPVVFLRDTEISNVGRFDAGRREWLENADAYDVERRGLGTVLAAVSLNGPIANPFGVGSITPDSQLTALPVAYAEKLEGEGKLKVLRSQADIDRYRAAWAAHHETVKEMCARARAMSKEADEMAKQADRFGRKAPVINWESPADPPKKRAAGGAE